MHRPTRWLVLGILNIVFGALVGLLTLKGLGDEYAEQPDPDDPVAMITAGNRAFHLLQRISLPIDALASAALVAAGIGLLRTRPWGRRWSLAFAIYALASSLVGLAAIMAWVTVPLLGQRTGDSAADATSTVVAILMPLLAVIGMVYPVLLLVLLRRDPLRAGRAGSGDGGADDGNPYRPPLAP